MNPNLLEMRKEGGYKMTDMMGHKLEKGDMVIYVDSPDMRPCLVHKLYPNSIQVLYYPSTYNSIFVRVASKLLYMSEIECDRLIHSYMEKRANGEVPGFLLTAAIELIDYKQKNLEYYED